MRKARAIFVLTVFFAIAYNKLKKYNASDTRNSEWKDRNHPKKRVSYNKYKKLHAVFFFCKYKPKWRFI
jgi:hypothetical protein